jgi:hypothetical protein
MATGRRRPVSGIIRGRPGRLARVSEGRLWLGGPRTLIIHDDERSVLASGKGAALASPGEAQYAAWASRVTA